MKRIYLQVGGKTLPLYDEKLFMNHNTITKMKKYLLSIALGLSLNATAQDNVLSHQQAVDDICNMVYTVSEVHPNMYGGCNELRFHTFVDSIARSIPDNISKEEFYQKAAQIIGMLNDSHSAVVPPAQDILKKHSMLIPIQVKLEQNKKDIDIIVTINATDSIPDDARIISINGVSANEIARKLSSVFSSDPGIHELGTTTKSFHPLFEMMYESDIYDIEYMPKGKKQKAKTVRIKPMPMSEYLTLVKARNRQSVTNNSTEPYSYRITDDGKVAILSFRSCANPQMMETFADDLVKTLNEKKIKNLIIDVTENSGGDANVGDALLKRICPKPFTDVAKMLERITPTTLSLLTPEQGRGMKTPELSLTSFPLFDPLPEAQRFTGKIYLLTSTRTFSSASLFANTFKEFGCGIVIGEETGGKQTHYGDIVYHTLPNSGLRMTISHKMFWAYGADEKYNHGTLPDVEVDADKALDMALEIIKNGGKLPSSTKRK